jgi:opacity protein-like surface antigen
MKKTVTAFAAALVASASAFAAADPIANLSRPFAEYVGAGPIGNNNLNVGTFYWMHESTGTWMGQDVNSWFLIWDPYSNGVKGTIDFDGAILGVMDERAELIATAGFGKSGVAYDYSRAAVGLEATDRANTSFSGEVLSLAWNASNPGDHARVFTAAPVPEPQTYALMLAGLVAVGFMARRRRPD